MNTINFIGKSSEKSKAIINGEIKIGKDYVTAEADVTFIVNGCKAPKQFTYKTKIEKKNAPLIFKHIKDTIADAAIYNHDFDKIAPLGAPRDTFSMKNDVLEALDDIFLEEEDIELLNRAKSEERQKLGLLDDEYVR